MRRAFFTSASFAYLDRARVLFQSLRAYHPDWEIWLCLVDEEPPGFVFDPAAEQLDGVVRASELGIQGFRSWAFQHNVVELCTAVKGSMTCWLLDQGADAVVYLDPDIALFSRMEEVELLLPDHSGLLTPHQLVPETSKSAIVDNEIGSLKYGIFNLGFLAVNASEEGISIARWWRDRLLAFCFDDVPNGLFTDQKWFNHAPVFFPSVGILRHRGYNVASWNLTHRPIAIDRSGRISAGGDVLRFMHFTKIDGVGETMLDRYSGPGVEVAEIVAWYRRELARHAVQGLPSRWWAYSSYSDGRPVSAEDRIAHRTAFAQGRALPNPFESARSVAAVYET